MALNDYEHIEAARALASNIENVQAIVKGGLDPLDILPLISEVSSAIGVVQPVLQEETKAEAEVKFGLISALVFISRKARALPDSQLKANILQAVTSAAAFLEINLPDEK